LKAGLVCSWLWAF